MLSHQPVHRPSSLRFTRDLWFLKLRCDTPCSATWQHWVLPHRLHTFFPKLSTYWIPPHNHTSIQIGSLAFAKLLFVHTLSSVQSDLNQFPLCIVLLVQCWVEISRYRWQQHTLVICALKERHPKDVVKVIVEMKMAQHLLFFQRIWTSVREFQSLVIIAPRHLTLSSGLQDHLCMYSTHSHRHTQK